MIRQTIYVVTVTSSNSANVCIEHAWTQNICFASLYAKMCISDGHIANINQYNDKNEECGEFNMLKVVTNNIGEQFLITTNAENNWYNIGAFKMVSNKYLLAYKEFFNRNAASAFFATLHVVNNFCSLINDPSIKQTISKLFDWVLDNMKNEVKLDYLTYYTLMSKHPKCYKIGATNVEDD